MESLQKLIAGWRSEGLRLHPPQPEDKVRRIFSSLGSVATADVVSLYGLIGGMDAMDANDWRLWSLEEIQSTGGEATDAGVVFSDYLIGCWSFRLKPIDADTSAVFVDRDGKATRVAATLREFFDLFAEDPLRLLDPDASEVSPGRS